jgi:hypothetical protein
VAEVAEVASRTAAPAGSVAVSDGTDITGSANLTWDDVGNSLGLAAAENGGGTIEAIGVGGQLFIRAHAGDATHVGGEVSITSGASNGYNGGSISVKTGDDTGGGDAGGIVIETGFATDGASGDIDIRVDPNDLSGTGGNVLIQAGTGQTGSGGDVFISAGSAVTSGTNGSVQILDGSGHSIEMNPSGMFLLGGVVILDSLPTADPVNAGPGVERHRHAEGERRIDAVQVQEASRLHVRQPSPHSSALRQGVWQEAPDQGPADQGQEEQAQVVRPQKLVIAGQQYEVRWVSDPTSGLARHANPNQVGHTDSDIGVMAVRTHDTTPTQERDTLLHEVIHACLELTYLDASLDHFKTKEAAERIVSVLSTHLLDTLRRNDGLVSYLVGDDWQAVSNTRNGMDDLGNPMPFSVPQR